MPIDFEIHAPYGGYVENGQFRHCIVAALTLLKEQKTLDEQQFRAAHKGTPFYIIGYASFASNDYSAASLFFDAALDEDLRNRRGHDTPALQFMQLDPRVELPNLAGDIIKVVTDALRELTQDYSARSGAVAIAVDDVRQKFLTPIVHSQDREQRALITGLISFVAEWHYRRSLVELIEHGSREVFFLHLLRGCLLFESLLKEQPKKPLRRNSQGRIESDTLRPVLDELKAELGLTAIDVSTRRGNEDFNAILAALRPNMEIEATINSVGKVRNTLGHNIVWASEALDATTYDTLVRNIAAACLHAISRLYR